MNDSGITFADMMNLDNYFRRQAARSAGLSATTVKLVRGALDLIFGFLPQELKDWLDGALQRDSLCDFFLFDRRSDLMRDAGRSLASSRRLTATSWTTRRARTRFSKRSCSASSSACGSPS